MYGEPLLLGTITTIVYPVVVPLPVVLSVNPSLKVTAVEASGEAFRL